MSWRVLWGLIMTNGSLKLSKEQYQSARLIADTFRRLPVSKLADYDNFSNLSRQRIYCLPHYGTLYKKYKPILYRNLTVRGTHWLADMNVDKAGARCRQISEQGVPQTPVLTVLPSEYAREDVACGPVFNLMKSTSVQGDRVPSLSAGSCVDLWPLVASREWFYGPQTSISVDFCSTPGELRIAEAGDTIDISVLGGTVLDSTIPFQMQHEPSTLRGKVLHIWTVHHSCRRDDPQFSTTIPGHLCRRDVSVVNNLSYISYTSPSDSVDVPVPSVQMEDDTAHDDDGDGVNPERRNILPPHITDAMRRRREALHARRVRMEDAWQRWTKPLIKPGDLVTLLKPIDANTASDIETNSERPIADRMCLVHRFWTENEERGRHLFLIGQDAGTSREHRQGTLDHCIQVQCS